MADRLDTHSPPPEIGVMITFAANTRSEVFLAGPNILSRTLNLPSNSAQTWIDTHRPKILNAARTKMREYPPRSQKRTVYVTLKEYCTETWRTMMVKTDSDPRALLLILTRSSDSEHQYPGKFWQQFCNFNIFGSNGRRRPSGYLPVTEFPSTLPPSREDCRFYYAVSVRLWMMMR